MLALELLGQVLERSLKKSFAWQRRRARTRGERAIPIRRSALQSSGASKSGRPWRKIARESQRSSRGDASRHT